MRITFFIGSTKGGGAERVVCNLANAFSDMGEDVQILTVKESDNYGLNKNIQYVSLESGIISKNKYINKIKKMCMLKRFLKMNVTDVYIIFLPIEICMFLHYRKIVESPIIVSERNDPSKYSTLMKRLLKYYVKKSQGIVFQTEDVKKWYNLNDKVHQMIIPNPINKQFLQIKKDVHLENNHEIVGVGRLTTQKNWEMLIRAYSNLPNGLKNYELVIYGEGTERDNLLALCQELGVEKRVRFPGFTNDVMSVLENARVFVMSSDYEGMPNSLMEAMAVGLPCISTDCPVGGPKYLIQSNENGILVSVNDEKDMTNALARILSNIEFSRKLGYNAKKIVEKVEPNRIAQQWKDFIENVKGI